MANFLSENIRCLRMQCGLSQVELAKKLNVSKQCVSNWENDNVLPSITMLLQLAAFFHTTTDFLLGREVVNAVELEGLTDEEQTHIRMLIGDLRKRK